MKSRLYILLLILPMACGQDVSEKKLSNSLFLSAIPYSVNDSLIQINIDKGYFSNAANLIRLTIANTENITPLQIYDLNFELEKMKRVERDFSNGDSLTLAKIREVYPRITKKEIKKWEADNSIEHIKIDGKKHYFHAASRNLFRINREAQAKIEKIKGRQSNELDSFLSKHIPNLLGKYIKSLTPRTEYTKPIRMKIRYSITVKPDEVPSGQTLRAWMPYPRTDKARHRRIKLLSASQPEYIIAPDRYDHKSIYMEKKAEEGKPTDFSYELEYTSYNKISYFSPEDIEPYDYDSELVREYTSERESHVIFTDSIKTITNRVIGKETNPYLKSKLIFDWIHDNFPWASAVEYSIIENIPEYVLKNRHGDCGQVSLLFITMARYAGIPAKWESGWMMHPNKVNLHDWAEVYYEGVGWVSVDQSFGRTYIDESKKDLASKVYRATEYNNSYFNTKYFFTRAIDAYRFIVNDDFTGDLYPAKIYPRSETVDFQRGEVEWKGENLYFGKWRYKMEVEYL